MQCLVSMSYEFRYPQRCHDWGIEKPLESDQLIFWATPTQFPHVASLFEASHAPEFDLRNQHLVNQAQVAWLTKCWFLKSHACMHEDIHTFSTLPVLYVHVVHKGMPGWKKHKSKSCESLIQGGKWLGCVAATHRMRSIYVTSRQKTKKKSHLMTSQINCRIFS